MSYIAYTKVYDTTVSIKPETQNVRNLVDASGTPVSAPTAFNSTKVTNNRGVAANNNANFLGLAALHPESLISGTITTTNSSGLVTSAPVIWPDSATGTLTQTADSTRPSLANAYVVTHILGGITKTYTQPAITRNASGNITVIPAIVVS